MTSFINPATEIDCYKFDHRRQFPPNTTFIVPNATARGSRIEGVDKVVVFHIQAVLHALTERWQRGFFNRPLTEVLTQYERRMTGMLGPNDIGTDHIRKLWELGHLPLRVRALDEGTECPLRIPFATIEPTHDDFAWLAQYIETIFSNGIWLPITSATTALRFRRLLDDWANKTSDIPEFVDWQGHDFSFRGMTSLESACASGAGHLLSFAGTDTVPALDWIEHFYNPGTSFIGGSVAATEHSVMCAGTQEGEADTFARLLDLYSSGIASIVSDTWDLWNVMTNIIPALKDQIMERDGKFVVRPDSGDPVDILCGTLPANNSTAVRAHERNAEERGVVELLWDTFGGTINSKGYKQIDPHVGAIYGDSITYDRADEICERLAAKGFASTNVVLGVGSFTYQYVTRDTFGFALKATFAIIDGEERDLFKDPVTDSGIKRSAVGRLAVIDVGGELTLIEQATEELTNSDDNLLRPVWENGVFLRRHNWSSIVDRVGVRVLR